MTCVPTISAASLRDEMGDGQSLQIYPRGPKPHIQPLSLPPHAWTYQPRLQMVQGSKEEPGLERAPVCAFLLTWWCPSPAPLGHAAAVLEHGLVGLGDGTDGARPGHGFGEVGVSARDRQADVSG